VDVLGAEATKVAAIDVGEAVGLFDPGDADRGLNQDRLHELVTRAFFVVTTPAAGALVVARRQPRPGSERLGVREVRLRLWPDLRHQHTGRGSADAWQR